ncbi:hypothetical protein [Streptomyces sp. ISL-94]|uniref:hypothetical protein n=1 Tax=Streptomyces sp. ISL-94 TaxID=2819190 RepID=UPI001BEC7A9C|nr:hypothetical protein [Streptomyces sp. ISL-94]MBT2477657.1 hypothetical protein [Streptomyces sp. ISL-94]
MSTPPEEPPGARNITVQLPLPLSEQNPPDLPPPPDPPDPNPGGGEATLAT